MLLLDTIIEKVRRQEIIPPADLANWKLQLAAEYGYLGNCLSELEIQEAESILEIREREEVRSERHAQTIWNNTKEGRDSIRIKRQLKSIEKLMNGISTRLKTYEQEQRTI